MASRLRIVVGIGLRVAVVPLLACAARRGPPPPTPTLTLSGGVGLPEGLHVAGSLWLGPYATLDGTVGTTQLENPALALGVGATARLRRGNTPLLRGQYVANTGWDIESPGLSAGYAWRWSHWELRATGGLGVRNGTQFGWAPMPFAAVTFGWAVW